MRQRIRKGNESAKGNKAENAKERRCTEQTNRGKKKGKNCFEQLSSVGFILLAS
jgi:hypothetical protein